MGARVRRRRGQVTDLGDVTAARRAHSVAELSSGEDVAVADRGDVLGRGVQELEPIRARI